jgi:hypothetical protein
MWNFLNSIAALGAFVFAALRNGFHMSITAKRTPRFFLSPSHS